MLVKKNTTLLAVDIEEDNADYQIFIDDKECDIYCFEKHSYEYGYKHIKIIVHGGRIKISPIAHAFYMNKKLIQNNYVDWFYSDNFAVDTWYNHDMSFYHLYPQGPSYFDNNKDIWDYKPTLAAYYNDKQTITNYLRNLICQ